MDANRWKRIKDICLSAWERAAADRPAYLEEACAGDERLLAEVAGMLAEMDGEFELLDEPIVRLSGEPPAAPDGPAPAAIGPYEVVRPLGRGGMGEVLLAVRDYGDFRQSVAIKVILRGMDTREVLDRFRVERRILGRLNHPNIAQLLDGGATHDGRPYFVMEYVEGQRIDDYCDRHRLSLRERLDLFLVVCGAVQHAHQNLVVHRDIKPGNILVSQAGEPKLLDFGIGKLLTPDPSAEPVPRTRTDHRLLTPEYASPEQVRGEPVTTATDVYGLGMLLYHLLAGRHPYLTGDPSPSEIERAACERDPEAPSTAVSRVEAGRHGDLSTPEDVATRRRTDPRDLRRRLAGDLDNIVLKALAKQPSRRYQSAAALADDVRRHMAGRPVLARPDTLRYRVGKFVRRNTWRVAAVVVAFVSLATATGVTLVQSARVAEERNRAFEERDRALDVRGFLLEMFGGTAADRSTGDAVTVRALLDRQASNLDNLYEDDPVRRAEMMEVLSEAYDRLGLYDEAEALGRDALALRRDHLAVDHPDLARSLSLLGWVLTEQGELDGARGLLEEAVVIRRAAGERYRGVLSRSLNDLGIAVEQQGDRERAEELYREALDIRLAELGEGHRSVGITANNLAVVNYYQGELDSAVHYGEQAVRSLRLALGDDHQRSVIAQMNLAAFTARSGDYVTAARQYRDLVERQRRLQGADHPVTAMALHLLGGALENQERFAEAEAAYQEALDIREIRLGPSHAETMSSALGVASAWAGQGRVAEAVEMTSRSLPVIRDAVGPDHNQSINAERDLARFVYAAGDYGAAERAYRELLARVLRVRGPEHWWAVEARHGLGRALLRNGRTSEALEELTVAHEAARDDARAGSTRLSLAEAHIELGHADVADSLLAVGRDSASLSREDVVRLRELRERLGGR